MFRLLYLLVVRALNWLALLDTARKCGINTMTALRGALSGSPWTPPLPATATGP
jgi:hypothetical protein